jgi:hypothetical protein
LVQFTVKAEAPIAVIDAAVADVVGSAESTVPLTPTVLLVPPVVANVMLDAYTVAGADALIRAYTVTGWPVSVVLAPFVSVTASEYVVPFNDNSKLAGAVAVTLAVRLAPLTVKVCAAEAVPVTVLILLSALVDVIIEGMPAGLIVKVCALDTAAPVSTVTDAVPAVAISAAVIAAVSWVDETKVVVLLEPFQRTVLPDKKLVPYTVIVKAELPATADAGEIDVVVGVERPTLTLSKIAVCVADIPPAQNAPISGRLVAVDWLLVTVPCEVRVPDAGSWNDDVPSFLTYSCHWLVDGLKVTLILKY